MSRPAAKHIDERTTDCETCGAKRGRPCMRLDDDTNPNAMLDHGPNVSPHAARLRAEATLRAEQRTSRAHRQVADTQVRKPVQVRKPDYRNWP